VVALDASTSMLARDVKPSRLERAKVEVSALLDRLRGDRVGLVVFAGEAFVQCPLTTDYSAAKLFLRAVDPAAMPQQGTAISGALREARRVLDGGARGGAGKRSSSSPTARTTRATQARPQGAGGRRDPPLRGRRG